MFFLRFLLDKSYNLVMLVLLDISLLFYSSVKKGEIFKFAKWQLLNITLLYVIDTHDTAKVSLVPLAHRWHLMMITSIRHGINEKGNIFPSFSQLQAWFTFPSLLLWTAKRCNCRFHVAAEQIEFVSDLLRLVLNWEKGTKSWEGRIWARNWIVGNKHTSKANKDFLWRRERIWKEREKEDCEYKERKDDWQKNVMWGGKAH